jgi:hypothetical protein
VRKNIKTLVLVCFVGVIFFVTKFTLEKLAENYVVYYTLPSDILLKFNLKNLEANKKRSNFLFSIFPSLLCPAIKEFINDKKFPGELRATVPFAFSDLPANQRTCCRNILVDKLNGSDGWEYIAAQALGYFGGEGSPALTAAWKAKRDVLMKMTIAQSMIRIGDKSSVPVLEESIKSDSFENVFALIALYEITTENKYKTQIEDVLKNGVFLNRALGIVMMNGHIANKNVLPFLKIGVIDKSSKIRKIAKKNINLINNRPNDEGKDSIHKFIFTSGVAKDFLDEIDSLGLAVHENGFLVIYPQKEK